MPRLRPSTICLMLCCAFSVATAQENASLSKEELAGKLNNVDPSDISDSPIPSMYQVAVGSNVAYVTRDGKYVVQGEIIDVENGENLTENTRERARVSLLASVDRESMIVFSPKNGAVKHTVTIFTDIDCGYCRQFHREIDKVNELGIEVHYLFYPRTGREHRVMGEGRPRLVRRRPQHRADSREARWRGALRDLQGHSRRGPFHAWATGRRPRHARGVRRER